MNEDRKLSITQRYLLTYIKFRTNNNHQFYAQNKAISEVIGCTVDSTKVIINKLIREGYITKITDDKGRRVLSLSGKEFPPLDGVNMGNISKSLLKQDIAEQEQWANYYQKENKELKASLEEMHANFKQAMAQIKYLENIISKQNEALKQLKQSENETQPIKVFAQEEKADSRSEPIPHAEEQTEDVENIIKNMIYKLDIKGQRNEYN